MTKTETIRLLAEDHQALLAFLRKCNAACNYASAIAFPEKLWHWLPLQQRARRGPGGQASAYQDKKRQRTPASFRPLGSIWVYGHRYKRGSMIFFYGFQVPFRSRGVLSSKHQ